MDEHIGLGPMLLLAGRANRPLAREIADELGTDCDGVTIYNFADGEIFVRIDRNARGRDVFIVQPTVANADNIMELLLLIDAAKRASAARVTAVVPYFGYGRQDRKDQPRVSIGAKLVANLILRKEFTDLVVVAPDVGSAKMARGFAKRLGATFAIIDKRRPAANVAEVLNVVGDVDGRPCLITDDMIDTGGTIANAVQALMDRGASTVHVAATHALLSGEAVARLSAAPLTELVVTNTIHIPDAKRFDRLRVLSVANLLSRAIRYIHSNASVSQLFEIRERAKERRRVALA